MLVILFVFILQTEAMPWKNFGLRYDKSVDMEIREQREYMFLFIMSIIWCIILCIVLKNIFICVYGGIIWCFETPEQKEEREKLERRRIREEEWELEREEKELEREIRREEKELEREKRREEREMRKLELRHQEAERSLERK